MSDDPREPLQYREGRADLPDRRGAILRAAGAAMLSAAAVFGCVFVWITSNLRIYPTTRPAPTHWQFPTVCTLAALAVLLAIGVRAWRRGDRWILLGLLIGVGIGALCEGICFAALT